MSAHSRRRPRPPLDESSLATLALRYVERFATTRSKLAEYLRRKLRERGWSGGRGADVEALVERFAEQGYVDDRAYALSKSRSLTARGYGPARVRQSLRAAGVADEDCGEAGDHAEAEAAEAAIRFARRRRFGPFANAPSDPKSRERALAAMVRAGHDFGIARAIIAMERGAEVDVASLFEKGVITDPKSA